MKVIFYFVFAWPIHTSGLYNGYISTYDGLEKHHRGHILFIAFSERTKNAIRARCIKDRRIPMYSPFYKFDK